MLPVAHVRTRCITGPRNFERATLGRLNPPCGAHRPMCHSLDQYGSAHSSKAIGAKNSIGALIGLGRGEKEPC